MNTLLRWDPSIIRWNPSKEPNELESRLATLFGLREAAGNGGGKESLTVAEWTPLVDIMETDHEYLIKAEVPDMKKEDVRLRAENDVLTISGERKFEKEDKGLKHHRVERAYGSFMRSFSLPEDADSGKVTADYKDGMLQVHLPKSQKPTAKAIEIKVA